MIAWSYYGLKSVTYLLGDAPAVENTYKVIFCIFCIVGASTAMENILVFMDAMVFAMAIPNVLALYIFAPELKRDIKKYLQGIKNK